MIRYYSRILIFFLFLYLPSCSAHSFKVSIKEKDPSIHKVDDQSINTTEEINRAEIKRLSADLKRLKSFSSELMYMKEEMYRMREKSNVWTMDYFPAEEHDKIENLLFRYLMIRNALWDIVNYYKDYRIHFSSPETQTKGFIIGYSAALHMTNYTSLLVAKFINEPMGKSKLNEAYPRSEIPPGTYNMLLSSVTSLDHMEAIKVAWILFNNEMEDSDSTLRRIYETDAEYRSVIDQIDDFYNATEERIAYILKEESLLFPKTENLLKHSIIIAAANKLKSEIGDNLYAIRGLLFSNVSDIKMPLTKPLSFSENQKNKIHSILEPGDIILTFTAGYMSNIFLPGTFKHGIIYVGTSSQRRQTGLVDDPMKLITGIKIDKLMEDFSTDYIDKSMRADVIEAVAEGVIFNSLDFLLDTHINRMIVLRPKISLEEKREVLTIAFALLGNDYDFKFDFNDGSYQCCTEVIYRALNSRGTCNFKLVKRLGTLTLSADDIIEYYLSNDDKPFDIILYAEKNRFSRGNKARLYTGSDCLEPIRNVMKKPS